MINSCREADICWIASEHFWDGAVESVLCTMVVATRNVFLLFCLVTCEVSLVVNLMLDQL